MHVTFICYYGMMILIQGIFDLVRVIDREVNTPGPMFSSRAGIMYNFGAAITLLDPISMILGAFFAYYLYTVHDRSESGLLHAGDSYGNHPSFDPRPPQR